MILFIKDKRPIQDMSSGKWKNRPVVQFYIIKEDKRVYITHMSEEVRSLVLSLTVENSNVVGKYNSAEDLLLYRLEDIEKYGLIVKEDTRIENLVLLDKIEVPK